MSEVQVLKQLHPFFRVPKEMKSLAVTFFKSPCLSLKTNFVKLIEKTNWNKT